MHPLLIYIHGFKSSSQSEKSLEIRQYLIKNNLPIDFLAPTFANYPNESCQQLIQIIKEQQQNKRKKIALIGSSLGGFMACSVAQLMNLKAVLVNPAVHPDKLICYFIGENINPHTNEKFVLTEAHIQELRDIEPAALTQPTNLLVMLQKGDEMLDYKLAEQYYKECHVMVESGGSHRFQHFAERLPTVLEFLELTDRSGDHVQNP